MLVINKDYPLKYHTREDIFRYKVMSGSKQDKPDVTMLIDEIDSLIEEVEKLKVKWDSIERYKVMAQEIQNAEKLKLKVEQLQSQRDEARRQCLLAQQDAMRESETVCLLAARLKEFQDGIHKLSKINFHDIVCRGEGDSK